MNCQNHKRRNQVGNGALAGISGVSASFPLDLIKTKFQLNKAEYKGKFINAARAVHAERGLAGLYGGAAINLALITPEKGECTKFDIL